ncbi:MAG TPA: AAA family ATPase [Anaerolineae bacterium]|nr:AAA family ATPase [Anaerolineae bacterium]
MDFEQQLDIYLRARFTLIVLATVEEERAVQTVQALCERAKRPALTWDAGDGFARLAGRGTLPTARDPLTALDALLQSGEENAVFVLKDFHDFWGDPRIKRKLRNAAQQLKQARKAIIVTTPLTKVPEELKDEAVVVELALPTADALSTVLERLTEVPAVKVRLTPLGREKLVQAALGLTTAQAQRVFSKAVVREGVLDDRDIELVMEEKKQIIRESEALEFYSVTETPDDVGGLGALKAWLRLRERAFTQEARDYGLPAPKGIALIGIPGAGKSLTAKMIGGLWRLPLLRLDVGALFGGLVGESETRTRRALHLAETVAPCIVWIDEMEKALAHGNTDSGASTRVFGAILTWMQEKVASCFVVATANDISAMPPELLRKGRFDEVFFLDLPNQQEREEIFTVHIRKRKRLPQDYDIPRLAQACEGYVGAEIEQAIIDAMYIGFNDGGREFTTDDVLDALRRLVPLSVSQREAVAGLRAWVGEGRAQLAALPETYQEWEWLFQKKE